MSKRPSKKSSRSESRSSGDEIGSRDTYSSCDGSLSESVYTDDSDVHASLGSSEPEASYSSESSESDSTPPPVRRHRDSGHSSRHSSARRSPKSVGRSSHKSSSSRNSKPRVHHKVVSHHTSSKGSSKSHRKQSSSSKVASKPVRNRKTKESRREAKKAPVINMKAEPHETLTRLIPTELSAKIDLKGNKLDKVIKRLYRKEPTIFEKIMKWAIVTYKCDLVVSTPVDPDTIFEQLYVCRPVVTSERKSILVEKASEVDEIAFRRLPVAFAKRNSVLDLFNKCASVEKKEEIAKPGKDKTIARMNWLINNDHGSLTSTASDTPCSEICILDATADDAEKSSKFTCIWQANTTRKHHLWCVVSRKSGEPAIDNIQNYLTAREAIRNALVMFIEAHVKEVKNESKKRKRTVTKKETAPVVKRKKAVVVAKTTDTTTTVVDDAAVIDTATVDDVLIEMDVEADKEKEEKEEVTTTTACVSSSSTSESSDGASDEDGPRIPAFVPIPFPEIPIVPTITQISVGGQSTADKRAALLAKFGKK